jgi:hypothetical protein
MLDLVKFMNTRWGTVVVLQNKARWRALAVCQGYTRKQIRARAAYMRKHGLNRHDRVCLNPSPESWLWVQLFGG